MMAHTRGDTFEKTFQLTNPTVMDWSVWNGRSQIRAFFADGEMIAELEFAWIDPAQGVFKIRADNTADWPLGTHFCDVELSSADFVFSTPVITVNVIADVTKDAP